jgi:leader peptidase (prepilin peptidase) / N-methyltransferase
MGKTPHRRAGARTETRPWAARLGNGVPRGVGWRYGHAVLLSEFPASWLIALAVCLGLLFGSFLNVVIYRVPRGENIATPPSSCPACGKRIRPWDNVPVVSWLVLRGRARCCGAAIAPRYPLVEALGGVLGWAVMHGVVLNLPGDTSLGNASLVFLMYFTLTLGLLAAVFIDLDHMLLPDSITLGGIALGVVTLPLRDVDWFDALLGGTLGFGGVWLLFIVGYRWLRGRDGMGLGDAKLLGLAGVWFGTTGVLFVLFAGAIQGLLVALTLLLVSGRIEEPDAIKQERAALEQHLATLSEPERAELEQELKGDLLMNDPKQGLGAIPFGPFLILAIYELLFFGDPLRALLLGEPWLAPWSEAL